MCRKCHHTLQTGTEGQPASSEVQGACLATKPEGLSLIPSTHNVERSNSCRNKCGEYKVRIGHMLLPLLSCGKPSGEKVEESQ